MKCFLSTGPDVDSSAVRAVLRERDVTVIDDSEIKIGEDLTRAIKRQIRSADFVVALLGAPRANAYYEIGIADGLGKPILVLGDADQLPSLITAHPHLPLSTVETPVLELALDQFLTQVKERLPARKQRPRTGHKKMQPNVLEDVLGKIREQRTDVSGRQLQTYVLRALEAAGVAPVSTEPQLLDQGADIAIRSKELERLLGSPLLVEIKAGRLASAAIDAAHDQLSRYLQLAGAKIGILLYLDRLGLRYRGERRDRPWILTWDAEDFIEALTRNDFDQVVLDRRNELVHGAHRGE